MDHPGENQVFKSNVALNSFVSVLLFISVLLIASAVKATTPFCENVDQSCRKAASCSVIFEVVLLLLAAFIEVSSFGVIILGVICQESSDVIGGDNTCSQGAVTLTVVLCTMVFVAFIVWGVSDNKKPVVLIVDDLLEKIKNL